MFRVGTGFDAHKFSTEAATSIRLGGVDVPYEYKLLAHSDGDAVLHALCDAILGALALGDIGKHFPDTDPQYKDADSRVLLRAVASKIADLGYELGNADITLIAQAPRVANYIEPMCKAIAEDLGVRQSQVSVKATTTEKMGFIGRKEGLAAEAVVLLQPQQDSK